VSWSAYSPSPALPPAGMPSVRLVRWIGGPVRRGPCVGGCRPRRTGAYGSGARRVTQGVPQPDLPVADHVRPRSRRHGTRRARLAMVHLLPPTQHSPNPTQVGALTRIRGRPSRALLQRPAMVSECGRCRIRGSVWNVWSRWPGHEAVRSSGTVPTSRAAQPVPLTGWS
jgi:hypothetical protein